MQCPRCHHENPPQAKFCEECATSLGRICASCGSPINPTAKFCPECAHPVTVTAGTRPRYTSPEVYTPKHLAERILTSKRALEGERKQVTVRGRGPTGPGRAVRDDQRPVRREPRPPASRGPRAGGRPARDALRLCRFWQIPIPLVLVTSQLGYAYALSGRLAEAVPLLAEAVELSKGRWGRSQRMAWLAEAHLLASRPDEAGELGRQALELARAQKERGHEAWALRLLGEIATRRDPLDPAATADHYRQALALATELGMRPLMAHCHLGLGKLYRRAGRPNPAQEQLTMARTMYREMGMRLWLEQAETGLGPVR
jgi:tetratricopeptide (TPR) repeat protein